MYLFIYVLALNGQSSSDNYQDDEKSINIVSKFSVYTTWVRVTVTTKCSPVVAVCILYPVSQILYS